jgi:hypothetical protein
MDGRVSRTVKPKVQTGKTMAFNLQREGPMPSLIRPSLLPENAGRHKGCRNRSSEISGLSTDQADHKSVGCIEQFARFAAKPELA